MFYVFAVLKYIFLRLVFTSPRLSLRLSATTNTSDVSSITISTTVTNTGWQTVKLLNDPHGPLSQVYTESFQLTHQDTGVSPKFIGVRVKYSPEAAARDLRTGKDNAFRILAPGESFRLDRDLGAAYDFTSSGLGNYTLTSVNTFWVVDHKTNRLERVAAGDVEPITIFVSGNLATMRSVWPNPVEPYNGCSEGQRATLEAAAAAAQIYASDALDYIDTHMSGTPRYSVWFGKYLPAYHSIVQNHFTSVNTNNFTNYTYDCTCKYAGIYAYVYPDRFGIVFLCPDFWGVPLIGTQSQAGILIHEATHFFDNARTRDYTYGQENCIRLAERDPQAAIDNAESHEFFAENYPPLL